jgi:hypothetical protein
LWWPRSDCTLSASVRGKRCRSQSRSREIESILRPTTRFEYIVDVSGSGDVERGDFVSTRSYPVLTRGHGDEVIAEVQQV